MRGHDPRRVASGEQKRPDSWRETDLQRLFRKCLVYTQLPQTNRQPEAHEQQHVCLREEDPMMPRNVYGIGQRRNQQLGKCHSDEADSCCKGAGRQGAALSAKQAHSECGQRQEREYETRALVVKLSRLEIAPCCESLALSKGSGA